MRKLGLILFLSALAASGADMYTFGSLPQSGSVQGAPGSTLGWGYTLENQSTSLWLVPTNLNAGGFLNSTPETLFDFPVLAPSTSAAETFDAVNSRGLFELTWDSSAPAGFSNTGTFTVDAQWWSGDPLVGGVFVSDAPSAGVRYTASVSASAVPEPGMIAATGLVLLALAATRRRFGSSKREDAQIGRLR